MEQLERKYNLDPLNHFIIRIGDLINFEGPILSLFQDVRNGHLYIFDWVDRDEFTNRWIIFQTTPSLLIRFLEKELPYNLLFENAVNNKYLYSDIGINSFLPNNNIFLLEEIPEIYNPKKDDYFDESDCPHYDKILSLVLRELENSKEEYLYNSNFSTKQSLYKNSKTNQIKSGTIHFNNKSQNYLNDISQELKVKKYQSRNFEIVKSLNITSIKQHNLKLKHDVRITKKIF